MTIRSHLVMLVCAALLPVLIFAAVLIGLFWLQQRSAYDAGYLERARAIAIALDTEIGASIRVLESLALSSDLDANRIDRFAPTARLVLSSQPSWSTVALVEVSGRHIFKLTPQTDELGPVDIETFNRVVMTHEPAMSGLVRTGEARRFQTEIAVPVIRGDLVTHVLVAGIEPRLWLRLLSEYPMTADATITLLDQRGVIVARTLNNDRWVGSYPSQGLLDAARRFPEGAYRNTGLEGQWFYSAHKRLPHWNWTVATGVPGDDVEAALRGTTYAMAAAVVLVAGLAVALALLFGRRIASPIGELAHSAKALASGGHVPAAAADEIAEIDDVTHAFEEAARLLREREQALNAAIAREQQSRADAEAANRGKDEFLAMLGHELRNPLNAITTSLAVLKRTSAANDAATQSRDVISRQVGVLRQLVDDLLDVARVTRGKIVLNRRPFNLATAVTRTLGVMREAGRLGDHDLAVHCRDAWIDGDETRIEQVVSNLIDNAVKYTPPGGAITVSVAPEAKCATLEVTDTGVGIAAQLLPRVFDLFTQGERTLDRAQGGLGLGLTLVRRLVELHGGRVAAISAGAGRGATFTVRIPGIDPPVVADTSANEKPHVASAKRVVIVEDNEDGRQMLKALLRLHGHEVHEADDGLGGVAQVLRVRPDVAIVDIGLPGCDGYEVARRVRAAQDGAHIRLVALTGYGQRDARERAAAAGFDGYLVKPIEPDALAEILAD
jgi:signal transduction histidine kinase